MQRGTRAVQHFNRVHRVQRNGQVEVVMRGLTVVDAKTIQQHQGLLEGASTQNQVSLSAARAALFEKDRRILAQQLLRRFKRESLALDRQHDYRSGRLRQGHGNRRTKNHQVLRGMGKLDGRRLRGS